jgi:carboxyl-terminal processing protease
VRTAPASYREYVIDLVVPGSPAAEAGLAAGDRIAGVDGRPASELAYWDITRVFQDAGRKVALEIHRGAEKRTVTLALRKIL